MNSVRASVRANSSFLSGSEFISCQMHVLESLALGSLSGQASMSCLRAEVEG